MRTLESVPVNAKDCVTSPLSREVSGFDYFIRNNNQAYYVFWNSRRSVDEQMFCLYEVVADTAWERIHYVPIVEATGDTATEHIATINDHYSSVNHLISTN